MERVKPQLPSDKPFQKIDCPSFGKRLFWPPYRLLTAV